MALDGEGGILWIGMYLFLRTKLPFPDREGLYLLKKHQECNWLSSRIRIITCLVLFSNLVEGRLL